MINYHSAISGACMVDAMDKNFWRLEVSNPLTGAEWRVLWRFSDDEKGKYQELRDALNQINRPVLLRIVNSSDLH